MTSPFWDIAEFGARNSFDAEKFRLVELAGDERDHVGGVSSAVRTVMRDTAWSRMMMPSVELISFRRLRKHRTGRAFSLPRS